MTTITTNIVPPGQRRPLIHADLIAIARMVEFEIRKEWPQFTWGHLVSHQRSVPSQTARLAMAIVAKRHRFSSEQVGACIGAAHSTIYDGMRRYQRGECSPEVNALVGKVVAALGGDK